MQYHPTGAAFPEQILGQLVTERVRGLGAQVCNADGEQFVYPLETCDVEAVGFIREFMERKRGVMTPNRQAGVWLDSPPIDVLKGHGTIAGELPAMVRQFHRFGIDMSREPILVYPTLHNQNGGVAIQPDASTSIQGLFVAGVAAAILSRNVKSGVPMLYHLDEWKYILYEAGLDHGISSPVILPDYTRKVSAVSEKEMEEQVPA